jgi:hypothetical protein
MDPFGVFLLELIVVLSSYVLWVDTHPLTGNRIFGLLVRGHPQ